MKIVFLLLTVMSLSSPVLAVNLFTSRLVLRPFSLADADTVYMLLQCPEIADKTCAVPYPYEKTMAEAWIKSHEKPNVLGKQIVFAIVLHSTDQLIGAISFDTEDTGEWAIGYWLGKDYWGNGYATEALSRMIEYGFEELKLSSIGAIYFSGNTQSGRVMQKCGMKYVGEHVKYIPLRGCEEKLITYKIIAGEILKLLYTDDYMLSILGHFLPEGENFVIIPPAALIFEGDGLLSITIRRTLQDAFLGKIVVMPIILHGNHWVGVIFRRQADGRIQVIYNDPLGNALDVEPNAVRIIGIIRALTEEMTLGIPPNVIDLHLRQQFNFIDCGPFTVDNLVRLARHAPAFDSLDRDGIIAIAGLQQPRNGNAEAIRAEHNMLHTVGGLHLPSNERASANMPITIPTTFYSMMSGVFFLGTFDKKW